MEIALAWLLAQKPWIVPIPGANKFDRLKENLGSLSVVMTADDLSEIEETVSKIFATGFGVLTLVKRPEVAANRRSNV